MALRILSDVRDKLINTELTSGSKSISIGNSSLAGCLGLGGCDGIVSLTLLVTVRATKGGGFLAACSWRAALTARCKLDGRGVLEVITYLGGPTIVRHLAVMNRGVSNGKNHY